MWRIGLLGASRIAPPAVITPAIANPDFQVTAVGARDLGRAQAYAQQHGIAHAYGSYEDLVTSGEVDVVYNALPPSGHETWTIAALEAGKAVLCEKPFAMDAGAARRMTEAATRTGRLLMEAFHYRYHNVIRRAEALVQEGALGPLLRAEANFMATIKRSDDELRWRRELGGGGLMDLGCYPIHALRTLVGGEPRVVAAAGFFDGGVDVDMAAEMAFPNGVVAKMASAMTAAAFSANLTIEGERGRLEIRNFLAPQMGCRFTTTINGETTAHPTDGPSTYQAQLIHLGEVLAGKTQVLTGGADAVGNMAVIDAIYAAAGRDG